MVGLELDYTLSLHGFWERLKDGNSALTLAYRIFNQMHHFESRFAPSLLLF